MDDTIPYIIVDNQRIAPLVREIGIRSSNYLEGGESDPPFGVVDRVTISSEARQRSRLYLEQILKDA
ncbi:uncharacterized protein Dvar_58060 [Desulfosarcina variabilis str. Montpellier]|uniref:hypothetical protein n=1 Tax=Desulfosarcina variabilis TaxID=2300 RepID=UPI003AFA5698